MSEMVKECQERLCQLYIDMIKIIEVNFSATWMHDGYRLSTSEAVGGGPSTATATATSMATTSMATTSMAATSMAATRDEVHTSMAFQLCDGSPLTPMQQLDEDAKRTAAGAGQRGVSLGGEVSLESITRRLVNLSSAGAFCQPTPLPTASNSAGAPLPDPVAYATLRMHIVKLDLTDDHFGPEFRAHGHRGADCCIGNCGGVGSGSTGHFNLHWIHDHNGRTPLYSATLMCGSCANTIDHASRTTLLKAPVPVLEQVRAFFEPTALVDGSKKILGKGAVGTMAMAMRTGVGAAQVADLLNQADQDAIVSRSITHAQYAARWYEHISSVANDDVWSSLPLQQRRLVFQERVAYLRCKGKTDKVQPIFAFLANGPSDLTGAHVINSFLAWTEAKRVPILRQMNFEVAKEILKADHSKTAGAQLGSTWVYNLLNESSTPLGHFLTETTSLAELVPWLKLVAARLGMCPKMLVLDDWKISRDMYIAQLAKVEAGQDWDHTDCVFWT
jgi:hypothetical protein